MKLNTTSYRQVTYVGAPLSASTQFKLVDEVADCVYPVFYALEKSAAQGKLVHLGQIYQYDDFTQSLTDEQRLHYHRRYSKPLLTQLHRWLKSQFHHRLVEPNSNLGSAIKYLLRHWHKLTQFTRVRGAPIDNNIVERALKIPIRVRKAALFYKTEHGATVASILTSLIETCIQCNENPVDYLVALQQNKAQIFKEPDAFLPWCYQDTLKQNTFSEAA